MIKATIKAEKTYAFTIGDLVFPGWLKAETWYGLVKYERDSRYIIATDTDPVSGLFLDIFDASGGTVILGTNCPAIRSSIRNATP